MAEKTYAVIKRTEYENRGNAPVYIDTSEILRESSGDTVMRLKLFNNCGRAVRSVYLNAGCFDSKLNLCVQLKNIPYVNVNAAPATSFGNTQLVEVPGLTRSVFVEISRILFDDGTVWANPKPELAEDIVSEEALGEEWLRLRLTHEIRNKEAEKVKGRRMSENKKSLIAVLSVLCAGLIVVGIMVFNRCYTGRQTDYKTAMNYYVNNDFTNAAPALSLLAENHFFFEDDRNEIHYSAALSYMNIKDYKNALKHFCECRGYRAADENIRTIVQQYARLIGAGYNHSAVVQKDGSVAAFGDNSSGQCDTGSWSKIIAVSAGGNHTVGLSYEGLLTACGSNEFGQCDLSGWTDVTAVATGESHTVGLKDNGRVVARGNNEYGQCDVQEWSDIVQVAVAANHTIGLKSDGTVLSAGWDRYGQCSTEGESNVAYIATGERNTALVRRDGTVRIIGDNSYKQCDSSELSDIVSASVGAQYVVCVTSEGRAVSLGLNDKNQGSVALWNEVMAVSCGSAHTLGLSGSGGVYAVGNDFSGQTRVSKLAGIGAENIPFTE